MAACIKKRALIRQCLICTIRFDNFRWEYISQLHDLPSLNTPYIWSSDTVLKHGQIYTSTHFTVLLLQLLNYIQTACIFIVELNSASNKLKARSSLVTVHWNGILSIRIVMVVIPTTDFHLVQKHNNCQLRREQLYCWHFTQFRNKFPLEITLLYTF